MISGTFHRADGSPKTVIVTGGAGGIGAQTIRTYHETGCNVVIADLPFAREAAENLIASLSEPSRALYHPTNIVDWADIRLLFRTTVEKFRQVDIVIANAGIMETLRLAMYSMKGNAVDSDGARGSIVLIASTSGYFGGTGVVSYITSKHGVVGLCRSSQRVANQLQIRVNVVAPFFTPTYITGGYATEWKERGLPANTIEDVATAIVQTSADSERKGHSIMVAGKIMREIETARTALTKQWLGDEIAQVMADGGKFFDDMGGYPLPKARG
ncbi:NAD(P)-binding protein [Melanomma pulvis-pyrius CBS 109.77]|uniref:NAD(P)-binding protein n=1 Tax=Melanomma pulvis-pyrius CBS 109.77 TaxID=1314802 RepID=A0A6A6XRZ2_9PLEO|nr:NAD(P)-binding protein [Melanomma pulvis-pyrius CBS 109.77]